MNNTPRIVFMGSPEFAIPSLMALYHNFHLVGVVTKPDKPAGRGRKLTSPAVKITALEYGIPIIQPVKLSSPSAVQQIEQWEPDLIVVAAYGKILRKNVLSIPKFGCINVHASLLPRWRGAAPIQAAILHGDSVTGCTIMLMDEGLDTGPILKQRNFSIKTNDTGGSLTKSLSIIGAELLTEVIPAYLDGDLKPIPQNENAATYAPMIKKSDSEIELKSDAYQIERKIRAYSPWPGTYINLPNQKRLKIIKAHVTTEPTSESKIFTKVNNFPAIKTQNGTLVLDIVLQPGHKAMSGDQYLRGAKDWGVW